jgi:hypothetical protein
LPESPLLDRRISHDHCACTEHWQASGIRHGLLDHCGGETLPLISLQHGYLV